MSATAGVWEVWWVSGRGGSPLTVLVKEAVTWTWKPFLLDSCLKYWLYYLQTSGMLRLLQFLRLGALLKTVFFVCNEGLLCWTLMFLVRACIMGHPCMCSRVKFCYFTFEGVISCVVHRLHLPFCCEVVNACFIGGSRSWLRRSMLWGAGKRRGWQKQLDGAYCERRQSPPNFRWSVPSGRETGVESDRQGHCFKQQVQPSLNLACKPWVSLPPSARDLATGSSCFGGHTPSLIYLWSLEMREMSLLRWTSVTIQWRMVVCFTLRGFSARVASNPQFLAQNSSNETYNVFAGGWVRTVPPGVDLLPRKWDSEQLLSALPQRAGTRLPRFITLFAITARRCRMCWLRDLVVRWGEIARNKMIITGHSCQRCLCFSVCLQAKPAANLQGCLL